MSNQDDGGPAFPSHLARTVVDADGKYDMKSPWGGMSLRDYFAGKALEGISGAKPPRITYEVEVCAGIAYELADAMLEARKAQPADKRE